MRAEPEEILSHNSKRSRFPVVELLLALAVIAGLVIFWFWSEEDKPADPMAALPEEVVPAKKIELPPTPDIPVREEIVEVDTSEIDVDAEDNDQNTVEEPAPLTPAEGGVILQQQLADAGADANLRKLASGDHPVDLTAALIDGMGRGIILRKMVPVERPTQAFSVDRTDDTLYMSPASYKRYDGYTDAITALNTSVLVETFHRLRPLYQQAYEQLGLDPDDFDNAIIRTLDMVLATPEIAEPIALKPKSVVYLYSDPTLESLPALQKQLLRAGPDNLRRIKQQARVLREGLLAQ